MSSPHVALTLVGIAWMGLSMVGAEEFSPRIWTSSNGRAIQATYVSSTPAKVTIKRADGKVFSIPLSGLSQEDRDYADKMRLGKKKPEAPQKVVWSEDWAEVKQKSAREKRQILLLFIGSDWSPESIKLEKEVLSQPDFAKFSADRLVLMKADFRANQAPDTETQNKELRANFMPKKDAYPTAVLLSPNLEVQGSVEGFKSGDKDQYLKKLAGLLAQ